MQRRKMAVENTENLKSSGKIFNIRASLLVALILTSINILLYSGIFNHSFVNYDDYRIIVNRIDTYDGFTLKNLEKIILEDYPREEPLVLRDISYLVNASLFGPLNPKGYLLGNLLLHILVCYLVYSLSLQIFPYQYFLAILAAVFFSIHPLHVESVAWISSRKDPLYTFFLLTALLAYIRSLKGNSTINFLASFLLFCCALFSKSAAISFFPLLLSYRITLKRAAVLTRSEGVFFIAVITSTLLFIVWYTGILVDFGIISKNISLHRDWGGWLLSSCAFITFYLEKLLLPINLSVSYDYPAPHILFSKSSFVYISACVMVGALLGLVMSWWKGKKQVVWLGLTFFSALLPYLNLAQVNIFVANRYTYLASSAFCLALAYGIFSLDVCLSLKQRIFRPVIAIICISYCTFLGFQTVQAIKPWENTLALWLNANRVASNLPDTYSFVMNEYLQYYTENKEDENARRGLRASLDLGERAISKFCGNTLNTCPAQVNKIVYSLGLVYWLEGNLKKAEEYFKVALRLDPGYHTARFMLARFLMNQKQFDEAMVHIKFIQKNANPNMEKDILLEIKNSIIPEIEKARGQYHGN